MEPGKTYEFSFSYTSAPEGKGKLSLTLKGVDTTTTETFAAELTGGEGLPDSLTFDSFGLSSPVKNGGNETAQIDIFVDDLTYGAAK